MSNTAAEPFVSLATIPNLFLDKTVLPWQSETKWANQIAGRFTNVEHHEKQANQTHVSYDSWHIHEQVTSQRNFGEGLSGAKSQVNTRSYS